MFCLNTIPIRQRRDRNKCWTQQNKYKGSSFCYNYYVVILAKQEGNMRAKKKVSKKKVSKKKVAKKKTAKKKSLHKGSKGPGPGR